jgi:Na+/melibiose symporter-like transporter
MFTMASFGFGQISEAVKNVGFNTFLLFYYNQVLGVSATGTSIALAIALVFDAFTDPLAGSLSDKFRSRWGRRHPFILFAAVPLAVTFYFLFHPPEGMSELGNILWLLVFAVLVRCSMTFYHVPHLALGAELTEDYSQRSTLYSFNTLFGAMGSNLFIPISYLLFFPTTEQYNPALLNQEAYTPWSLFAGAIMIFAIVVCFLGTFSEVPRIRDNIPAERKEFSLMKLLRELRDAFGNRSFRAIFFGMMLSSFILAVEGIFNPFMGFHFWGMKTEQLSFLSIGALTGLIMSVLVIGLLTRRFEKKHILIGSAALTIVNINTPILMMLGGVSWFPEQGSDVLLVILALNVGMTSFLGPVIFATLNSMFADITDEHELETGERREGVIFAARAFALKATSSFGLIFGGILLDFIQFPRGASIGEVDPDVVWQLGFIAGPSTSVFTFTGLLLYMGYRISRQRHQEILEELRRKK